MIDTIFALFVLFAAHCIGDYPLQGEFLAQFKSKSIFVLLCHCTIYTAVIMIGFWVLGLQHIGDIHMWSINVYTDFMFVIFLTHFVIDKIKCIYRDAISKEFNGNMNHPDAHKEDVLGFYVDQFLHCLVLIIIYIMYIV